MNAQPPTSGFGQKFDRPGLALAFGGAILFSAKGIFIKLTYQLGSSTDLTLALRVLFSLPVFLSIFTYLIWRYPQKRSALTPKTVLGAMGIGCLGYYVASYLDFAGLEYISAQYARLVLLTYPFFTVMLGVLFFGDQMKRGLFTSLLISWSGLALIFGWNMTINAQGVVVGTLLVLGAAITFALYQHLAKRQMNLIGATLFTCIGSSAAGVAALIHLHIFSGGFSALSGLDPTIWIYGAGLGIISTVLPTFMLNAAIHRVGARITAVAGTFGPVFTIIFAILILGETFTIWHLFGSALVLFGAYRFGQAERATPDTTKTATTIS